MPKCLKCGDELPLNEDGGAPVLCDNCAGKATSRARVTMRAGALWQYPATTVLIAINVAVYLIDMVTGSSLSYLGANYGVLTVLHAQYWRLVTAGFLHGGIMHIAFNMWILWSLGRLSERIFGKWQTVFIYLLTGVGGALLSIAYNIDRIEVGASGAIFGIAGAIIVGLKFGNLAISEGEKKAIFSNMIFFVAINFALGSGMLGGLGARTDNMCHLGGFVTGALIGVPLGGFAQHHRIYQWVTIVVTAAFLTLGYKELEKNHGVPQELQNSEQQTQPESK
jgi:membrane associated rhomboid family serine protease